MNDLFGAELQKWLHVEKTIHSTMTDFGFSEIRTPVLEKIEVFNRTVGNTSDIVEKQMYTLQLPGEVLAMRPEGTAAFMRAVVEHQLHQTAASHRYYYYLPMFRHERPQKGRLRQFHQFGAELIQNGSPHSDAELIALVDALFRKLGLSEFRTRINTVGCNICRPPYREELKSYLSGFLSEFCEQCQKRWKRVPIRVLDCKNESCKSVASGAPRMADNLCNECKNHHFSLQNALKIMGVPFENDPSIVRGLDYYVRTAFEFSSAKLGAQDALGGGGRYDGLSTYFGKADFPGVGFAAGMERVILALEASERLQATPIRKTVFLAGLGATAFELLFKLSFSLKRSGIPTQMSYEREKGLKNLLKLADKCDATLTVVLGDNEIARSIALVKAMTSGEQTEVSLTDLPTYLKTHLCN